jgi:choline-sulfatase
MTSRAILVGPLLLGACGIAAFVTHSEKPRNAVIITLDTTRADFLPAYGFSGIATPAMDGLARDGAVFEAVETVAPLTLTAHTSMFTGLYPPRHGVRDNLAAPLDAAPPTLAGILHAHGLRTAAFVGSAVLRRDRGLARGFDVYDDGASTIDAVPRRRSAQEVVDAARAWIAARDTVPYFLWVHLYDAHAPQQLPMEFRRAYGDTYQGAIAYMDSQIERLLDALRAKGDLNSTVVLIVGDHGESLGDHGEREHGIFLYESALHVPAILRVPGVAARRVPDLSSVVDVFPTMLDVLGIPGVAGGDGRSLLPVARGASRPERAVYAESMYASRFGWSPLRMIRDERFKFIDAPRPELYDLATDPFEQHNLVSQRVAVADAMRAEFAAVAGDTDRRDTTSARLQGGVLRQLAALGYVSGRSNPSAQGENSALDPKDYIQVYNTIRERPGR